MKVNSRFFRKLGAIKVYGDVARYYLNLIQFIVIMVTAGRLGGFSVLEIALILVGLSIVMVAVVFFHVRYIMPNEFLYTSMRSPTTLQMLKNTKKGENLIDF